MNGWHLFTSNSVDFSGAKKTRIETQPEMGSVLSGMGMSAVLTDKSDLSGMDGTRNVSIHSIVHNTYVEVDEKGTRAAMATAVIRILSKLLCSWTRSSPEDHCRSSVHVHYSG